MTDVQQLASELKAANAVRRIIQKLRLATPETYDELETELFDCMDQQIDAVGGLHSKVQEEMEKGLELGRQRVEHVKEQREKEAEMAQRPKELIEEIQQLMEALQGKLVTLREAACLDRKDGVVVQVEDADLVRKMSEECAREIKEFSQACVSRATEIKEATLPPDMKRTWTALAHQIVEVKRRAEATVTSAKAATFKATEALRKQRLEDMKGILRTKIKDSTAALPIASETVAALEQDIEPFIYGVHKEEVLLGLAERVDDALAEAEGAVANARQEVRPLGDELLSEGMDELLKKDIKAWVKSEERVPRMRLGQLDRRLARIGTIVQRWRKERSGVNSKARFEALKAELLAKIQGGAGAAVSVESAEPAIKAAEKAVESCGKHKTMPFASMAHVAEAAAEAVNGAKEAFDAVNQELCPLDPSLDEEMKARLQAVAAPHLKRHQVKLGQYERRLVRAQNLLAQFKAVYDKRKYTENDKAREAVRKIVRNHLVAHEMTAEALFEAVSAHSVDSSVVDRAAFLAFFEQVNTFVQTPGGDGEEEEVILPQADLEAFFASYTTDGEEAVNQECFLKLIGSRLTVAKATTLTSAMSVSEGKVIRALRVGEELHVLEGPLQEPKVGLMRVKIRCPKDGKTGWASMAGNAGTVFLTED